MAYLRLTLIEPKPGQREAAGVALAKLDERLARTPGLILSFVTQLEADRLGRVALWRSKDEANRAAMREDVLALRARLLNVALKSEETLMEVRSGYLPGLLERILNEGDDMAPVALKLGAVA